MLIRIAMKKNRCMLYVALLLMPLSAMGQTLDFERDTLLTDLPYPNLLNILSARVPGFQISPVNSAEGNMSVSMTLRGMNRIPDMKSGDHPKVNAPLIVVDGLIWYGSISDINTADVAKVEILRDAAALFGSRAANGAILITTRKGKTARPQVRFRAAADVSDWSHRPDGVNETWTDIISRRGIGQQYDLSVSGATRRLNYYVCGDFSRKEGILLGDDYREAAVLARLEYRPLDWLQLSVKGSYTNAAQWGQTPRLQNAFWMGEDASEYCTTPGYESWPNLYPDNRTVNPLIGTGNDKSYLYTDRRAHRNDYRGMAYLRIRFPFLEGLSFRSAYQLLKLCGGEDVTNDPRLCVDTSYPASMDDPDRFLSFVTASVQTENGHQGDWENELRYARSFGGHSLSLYAVYGQEEERYNSRKDISYRDGNEFGWTELNRKYWYSDACAGLDYAYGRRFFAHLAFRRDQIFWLDASDSETRQSMAKGYCQAALAWAPVEDRLKLRVSWSDSCLDSDENILMADIGKIALGVDFSLPGDRLSGTVEGYADQSHLFMRCPPPYIITLASRGDCAVSNKGVEVSLHSLNLPGDGVRSFRWESDLLLAVNRNRIEKLYGETDARDVSDAIAYGYDRYFAAVTGYPVSGIHSYDASAHDILPVGDGDPSFTLNLGNTLRWQKVSLYFNLRWMYGKPDHFLGYDSAAQEWVSRNFLKISDMVLSYDLNRHLRFFVSGANLLTLTHWPALDPENGGTISPHPTSERFVSMPTFRTLRMGVSLGF